MKSYNTTNIKTFWFDLGNVILDFDLNHSLRKLKPYTHLTVKQMMRRVRSHRTLEADLDMGRVGARDLFRLLNRNFTLRNLRFDRFKSIWRNIFTPNPEVISLIRKLKKNGYRMILISNTNRLHYDHIESRYPIVRIFHRRVLSFRLKTRKPRVKIYHYALRYSNAKPHEIFYIDDHHNLTQAAKRLVGVKIHTYRSFGPLKAELQKLKVRL